MASNIGTRIREARLAKAWKQKQLAARVRVEPQTVSNWERGRNVPDFDKLHALSRELGRPVQWFLGLEDEEDAELVHRVAALETIPAPVYALGALASRLANSDSAELHDPEIQLLLGELSGAIRYAAGQAGLLADRLDALREPRTGGQSQGNGEPSP